MHGSTAFLALRRKLCRPSGYVEDLIRQKRIADLLGRRPPIRRNLEAGLCNPVWKIASIQAAMVVAAEAPEAFHAVRDRWILIGAMGRMVLRHREQGIAA